MNNSISIVLGTYNRRKFLKLTIESIRKEISEFNLCAEIIVVDGGSTDGTSEWLFKQKDIITIIQHNHGKWKGAKIERKSWGYFMNLGFKSASGKYICMVSDDCLIVPGSIKNGIEIIEKEIIKGEKIGGAAFYWRDFPGPQSYWVGALFDATYLINHGIFLKNALEMAGYINEVNFQFYFADSDLCLRLNELGFKILLSEKSFIEHYSHANFKQRIKNSISTEVDKNYFMNKWNGKKFLENPYFDKSKTLVDYIDPAQTGRLFKKAQLFNYYLIKSNLKKFIKRNIN